MPLTGLLQYLQLYNSVFDVRDNRAAAILYTYTV